MVHRTGVPLVVILTAADVHDSRAFEELVNAVPPVRRKSAGRPRRPPRKLHADKAYDIPRCRTYLRRRGIRGRIARRRLDSAALLGRHSWVVERTLAWIAQFRRLVVRYERRADMHRAFLVLACSLVCLGHLPTITA